MQKILRCILAAATVGVAVDLAQATTAGHLLKPATTTSDDDLVTGSIKKPAATNPGVTRSTKKPGGKDTDITGSIKPKPSSAQ